MPTTTRAGFHATRALGAIGSVALALGAGAARALPLSDYSSANGDVVELFVSGSSAQDNSLQRLFRLICEPSSLDVYRGDDVRLYFCRTRSGAGAIAGIPPNLKIAFHKSSVGGSGNGVGPLIQRTTVQFFNVEDLRGNFEERCPASRRASYPADGPLSAYTEHRCRNPKATRQVPDVGISDVEPRFFLAAFNLAPSALTELTVQSANALIFGVPVNRGLRDALQAARFPATDPCNPANSRYQDIVTTGSGQRVPRGETESCMPSLSRAQLAGIFSGSLTKWSSIVTPEGYALAERLPESGRIAGPPGVVPPVDDDIYVCRRVRTSGTQAAYEMFFLNERCADGVRPFVESGPRVFLGSVTNDVKACLSSLDEREVWAVGIMSTDSVATLPGDRWRFIKMDGVAPTLLNTYHGRWSFFVEQSYQWRNERSEQPLRGAKLTLMSSIGSLFGDSSIIRDLNRAYRHAWGNAGVVALSSMRAVPSRAAPGRPVTAEDLDQNPTIAVRHQSGNCSAVVPVHPTALP